jgi:hypothetical protein
VDEQKHSGDAEKAKKVEPQNLAARLACLPLFLITAGGTLVCIFAGAIPAQINFMRWASTWGSAQNVTWYFLLIAVLLVCAYILIRMIYRYLSTIWTPLRRKFALYRERRRIEKLKGNQHG